MQNRSLGTHVFPTPRSDNIRDSPALYHFSRNSKDDLNANEQSSHSNERIQHSRNLSDSITSGPPLFHYSSNRSSPYGTGKLTRPGEGSQQSRNSSSSICSGDPPLLQQCSKSSGTGTSSRCTGTSQATKDTANQQGKTTQELQKKSVQVQKVEERFADVNPPKVVPYILKSAETAPDKRKESKPPGQPKAQSTKKAIESVSKSSNQLSVPEPPEVLEKTSCSWQATKSLEKVNTPEAPKLTAEFLNTYRKAVQSASKSSNQASVPENLELLEKTDSNRQATKSPEKVDIPEQPKFPAEFLNTSEASNQHTPTKSLSSKILEKQKIIAPVIEARKSTSPRTPSEARVKRRSVSDGMAKEILKDLDSALESDEHMSVREIRQNIGFTTEDDLSSQGISSHKYVQSAYKSKDNERQYEIKSNKDGTTVAIDELVKELKKLPAGVSSLGDYKREQKKMIAQRQKELEDKIAEARAACTPKKFLDQVPKYTKENNVPIPEWKREVLAKKIASNAAEQKEKELREGFQQWKEQFKPKFRM